MKVVLGESDLDLEVDQLQATPTRRTVGDSVEYTFGLGMTRKLALRWLPKTGSGTTDRTLSANSDHDVYAFHWAILGVSKITYSFSSGDYSRFALLVPEGATLTELKGTNIRDFRQIDQIDRGSTSPSRTEKIRFDRSMAQPPSHGPRACCRPQGVAPCQSR
jgi:hypothetical protein